MGGVYGEINSRADFERVLREAIELAERLAKSGAPAIVAIAAQLGAMAPWGAEGGEPTEQERKRINVGLIAVRELDDERQDESGALARKLFALNNYAADWPTDEQARTATDADYWRRFGL
jgi:hypothetical protein